MALKPEPAAASLSQSFINFTSSVLGQDVHVDSLDDRHIHDYVNWSFPQIYWKSLQNTF